MTLNIWVGGEASGQPLSQIAKVVEAAHADLVGLQETHGAEKNGVSNDAAQAIASQLGWQYFDQGDGDIGVVSRYKIVDHTPKKSGAAIELPSGRRVWLFNVHFVYTPYQPYQLLKIPYNDAPFITTAAQAIDEARKVRGKPVAAMLDEVAAVRGEGAVIFVTGDFNEPSALDWTDAVAAAGRCPVAVRWPSTAAILDAGFVDAYRVAHPDPLKSPGHTWTPTTGENDANDRHDRIDFVLVNGHPHIEKAEVIGENADHADIAVTPYPSDHRGVVATFSLD
jgi:endonuclease/exonuclease/phosphatase family metal-dependent hydrolase